MQTAEIDLEIRSGGETLSVFEIMQRFRCAGSCEYLVKDALVRLARAQRPDAWKCRECGRSLDADYPGSTCVVCLDAELVNRQSFMERRGYRRCDVPVCNCDSWHGGHAEDRLSEIRWALGDPNGVTILSAVEQLVNRVAELERLETCESCPRPATVHACHAHAMDG